ncbi:MAG: asparagine synthase (glutamine-hydrolyzing) [Proteobacteria bacterium]|nr:asparagine synthase (glutamine-hydrolyzing) [Pseudomonadota bacterium]
MCGICGVQAPRLADRAAHVARMNQALFHRGPDGVGQFDGDEVSLAMRRLAIIDLAGGQQPLKNEDGALTIVFNGEIYNYRELRQRLEARGHRFATASDTEVIVHLYEDHGAAAVPLLKGMFACCVHDRRDGSLFLTRDRFGEKPLYYWHDPAQGFAFSSEVRSLLELPLVPRRLDREALGYYLRLGMVPAPLTMLRDVRMLPAGHWMRYREGQLTIGAYDEPAPRANPALADPEAAAEAVHATVLAAVRRQSISDVPLGAFLSGGIDSSTVVALLQQVVSGPVKTFTVRFEEAGYDESGIARAVATHLGTEHHELVVPNLGFGAEDFWRIVDHVGLPFYDTSALPTYVLSKYVREHVTVALSGDGGDEMFAGYPFFRWGQTVAAARRVPEVLRRGAAAVARGVGAWVPASQATRWRRLRRGLEATLQPPELLPVTVGGLFELGELETLVRDPAVLETAAGALGLATALPAEAESWSVLRRLMHYRVKVNLPEDMLTKVDRMSMAASLEVRAPLLDPDVAELALSLPDALLISGGVGKSILRRAMRRELPAVVFDHPKRGFSIPLHRFQNAAYAELAHDLLADNPAAGLHELLAPETLRHLLTRGLARQSDDVESSVFRASHQLWALMQLGGWLRRFGVVC